jgi:phosphinothricin acetyltransferase
MLLASRAFHEAAKQPFIRPAREADLPAINEIYNHFVLHSTCTYQTEPSTAAERLKWFHDHVSTLQPAPAGAWRPQYPITVLVPADRPEDVLGWASLNPFHPRAAYRFTTENSVYVHHAHHRQGLGRALLQDLLARADALGFHSTIALISADQAASISLHRAFGFVDAGYLKRVGFKFDRWLDVTYLQRERPGPAGSPR